MDTTPARPRLEALSGLRYLAALTVLFAHMSHNLPWPEWEAYLSSLSGLGMPLFFVLSGFLMAYNYTPGFRADYRRTLRGFYVARVARLYPVYLVTLLLFFSFVGNFWHDWKNRRPDTLLSLGFVGTLTQSWVHIPVFTDYMHPRTVCQSYMGVAWSVSVEAFFYLLFPLVALPVARVVTGRWSAWAAVAAVFAAYLSADVYLAGVLPADQFAGPAAGMSRARWLLYLSPYLRFGEFLIGAVAGQLFLTTGGRGGGWRVGAGSLTAAAVGLVGLNFWVHVPPTGEAVPTHPRWLMTAAGNVLYAPLCAVIVYQLAALPSAARRSLGCPPMVLLGEMSYALYLLHPLAQSFYHERAGGEGPLTKWYIIAYNNLAMIAVLHFLALGLYRYVEVPARTAIRDRFAPRPAKPADVLPMPTRKAA